MKALQSLIGAFPSIELGGVAERPEALRKWRFATTTSLEAAGPHVTTWWDSCWAQAEAAHRLYLQAPVMNREGLRVQKSTSQRYAQLESWLKPRVLAAMPSGIRKQVTARGIQGIRDETQDILFPAAQVRLPRSRRREKRSLAASAEPTNLQPPRERLDRAPEVLGQRTPVPRVGDAAPRLERFVPGDEVHLPRMLRAGR